MLTGKWWKTILKFGSQNIGSHQKSILVRFRLVFHAFARCCRIQDNGKLRDRCEDLHTQLIGRDALKGRSLLLESEPSLASEFERLSRDEVCFSNSTKKYLPNRTIPLLFCWTILFWLHNIYNIIYLLTSTLNSYLFLLIAYLIYLCLSRVLSIS